MVFKAKSGCVIPLGYMGEGLVTQVAFDVSGWLAEYGEGSFQLLHRRRCDADPLPVAVDMDGNTVIWTLTESDTAARGFGQAQLLLIRDGMIKKSEIFTTSVKNSLTSGEDVPSPMEGWVEQVVQAGADAENAAAAAAQSAANAGLSQISANGSASAAARSASSASDWNTLAHAWANGGGQPITPGANNNAKYYAEQAGSEREAAQTARGAAETAQGKAETAQGKAETAQGKAETAQGKAEDAQEAAETAQGKAEDAQTAAEAAQTAAETAASTFETDPTLTVAGKAADAKATGDTIGNLDNRVDGIEDLTGTVRDISGLITLRDGSIIKKSDGTAQSGAGYSRTNDYVNITGYSKLRLTIPVITSSTTSLGMAFYRSASTEEGSYISGNNVVYNAAEAGWELREYDIPEGANYFRSTWWGSSNALYGNFHCELVKNGAVTTMAEQDVTGTTVNGYVKEENGSFASSTSYTRTRLIPVFSGCSYYYTGRIYSGICVAGYDLNKVFVGPVLSTAGTYRDQLLTIPDTVKYIAACRINSDSPALKVVCRGELLSAVYETAADEANEYFPNMQPEEMTSVSLFERIGVLGDSYSCGAIYDIQGATGGVHMNMSWPKILGRMSGTTCIPYADPGTTAKTFLTKSMCMPQLLADPACNLYLFMLGINTETTGTIADINDADYTQNADTFYGNMGRIYMQIMEHAPKAKVIFIKFPFKGTTAHWDAVEEIAEHYSCPCIDAGKEKYFSSPFYSSSSHQGSGHPVGVTYAGMAKAMRRQIEKCMADNFDYFKNYTGND